jgi:hypothetical protein
MPLHPASSMFLSHGQCVLGGEDSAFAFTRPSMREHMCVSACVSDREREGEREGAREKERGGEGESGSHACGHVFPCVCETACQCVMKPEVLWQ